MMMKSGIKNIFKIPPCTCSFKNIFYIIERRIFTEIVKFTNENDMFCALRDFKKKFVVGVHMINETFKPKIASIFHIEPVNNG